jgi:hypothetical protein
MIFSKQCIIIKVINNNRGYIIIYIIYLNNTKLIDFKKEEMNEKIIFIFYELNAYNMFGRV